MIISKTPVRIAFGGGGTDVDPYASEFNGYVINSTINLYFRSILNERKDSRIFIYSNDKFTNYNFEKVQDINKSQAALDLIKAILYYLKPTTGLDIYLHGEPPKKAGLGASASLSTSLIAGIMKLQKKIVDINEIAEAAFSVEQNILKNAGGRQDQYAAVYGGFNELKFLGNSNVKVSPINIPNSFKKLIEQNIILFYTGEPHISGNLVQKQIDLYISRKEQSRKYLDRIKEIAFNMKDALKSEDFNKLGNLLTDDWKVKTNFNPLITTEYMKELHSLVMKKGGIGGRVCGAGGGGSMIWLVNPNNRKQIASILKNKLGFIIDFKFIEKGLEILNI